MIAKIIGYFLLLTKLEKKMLAKKCICVDLLSFLIFVKEHVSIAVYDVQTKSLTDIELNLMILFFMRKKQSKWGIKLLFFNLEKLGYEVGTGCLVGLPEQTINSLAEDILFFKEINADMVGIGPFIAHPHTPLKDCPNGDFTLALKVMALTRIMLKNINIPATTAMETLNPNGRIIALQSGANVVMPNVTTTEYRAKYEIYPNKICINENPSQCFHCISGKIKSIGRTISTGYGFRNYK